MLNIVTTFFNRPYKLFVGSFFILTILGFSSCKAQPFKSNLELPLHYPKTDSTAEIVEHIGYSLQYNEQHEQADWVAYVNTPLKINGIEKRKDAFKSDPLIASGSAENSDYYKSGYDRGHLAPAADMKWSKQAMKESFYLSNMSPQLPAFNRGVWKKLEEKVRAWSLESDSIYVITGPLLEDTLPSIGLNKVSIPNKYFKALVRFERKELQGIAFLLDNEGSTKEVSSFLMTIDELEERIGIDLFYGLEKATEQQFESSSCIPCWFKK